MSEAPHSNSAYLYSLLVLTVPGLFPEGTANLYFEATAVIVTLIPLGRYLESLAKGRASEAIRLFVSLPSKEVRVIRQDACVVRGEHVAGVFGNEQAAASEYLNPSIEAHPSHKDGRKPFSVCSVTPE